MVEYNTEIARLEDEIKKTQYNKATQHHIGLIKAKIAKLRQKQEARGGGGSKIGFQVRKTGDGTVLLLGFPSTGKSTLLNALCGTESAVAAYAFTTVTVVPGTLTHRNARIQILDVPGIVEGASTGRGRGKEVLACIHSADLCVLIADVLRPEELPVIMREASNVGIRLNQRRPDVQITKRSQGGINILNTVPLRKLSKDTISGVLREFRITNADIVLREDITVDQLIDCIEHNKTYMPAIVVFTKKDLATPAQLRAATKHRPDLIVSAKSGEGIVEMRDLIYDRLELMNVFLKEPGKPADMDEPLILRSSASVRELCAKLHKDFVSKFKFVRVWGKSSKFPGQKLMLNHILADGDVVEVHLR